LTRQTVTDDDAAMTSDVHSEAEQLKQVPMFSRLDASRLKLLAFTSESLQFAAGQILFNHSDPSDAAYVIMEGEVEILGDGPDGEPVALVTRGRNELVGEMAALSNAPRSATLRAKGPVRVLKISNDDFVRLLTENPEVALSVMRELSDKLAKSHEQVEELQNELNRVSG